MAKLVVDESEIKSVFPGCFSEQSFMDFRQLPEKQKKLRLLARIRLLRLLKLSGAGKSTSLNRLLRTRYKG